ncbi:unnamed protein product [Lymnaea stagnalis]|uniref:Uncharacterized protein n=1 Tax=Lymnaea stagnalis TaxID=6523 RepID=A0AAV2INW7_LYMST
MNGDHKKNMSAKFKIVLLGQYGVGKSSIFLRIRDGEFLGNAMSTIGVDYCIKDLKTEGTTIQLSLWDTAGVEKYRTLTQNFYRNADAVLYVFSVNEPTSLLCLNQWEEEVKRCSPSALRFLIGNKADLSLFITRELMEGEARKLNCESVFIMSAKTGNGVVGVLETVSKHLLSFHKESRNKDEIFFSDDSIHVNQGQVKKSTCC